MRKLNPLRLLLLIVIGVAGSCSESFSQQWNPNYSVGTVTGKYVFDYNTKPDQLVEIIPPVTGYTLTYQWESSPTPVFPVSNPTIIGTQSSYTFPGPLTQTMYYR